MARKKKRKSGDEKANPDLTPMIDVTFQLLIFFILCTRFKVDERNHRVDLPLDEGLSSDESKPKEQITIYCAWDDGAQQNHYQVAIGARGRKVVEGSHVGLQDIVIFPSDNSGSITEKKTRYQQIVKLLVERTQQYITDSGMEANIEKLELAYAKDNVLGAKSGTTPWMFVSLAIDAASKINQDRVAKFGEDKEFSVTFKFADASDKYADHS
ncbi:biopolymer transporter ExbD [Planctomycetota bacterium]|nr:biopolymer transporter ExbD [Planctomycetota bacterium]